MIDIEKPLLCDVGVHLGRRQISVSEQFLNASQVGTPVEQVGRKAMSQGVRTGGIDETGPEKMGFE